MPASGFFDLDTVFATGPYAAYPRASKERIFKAAQNRLKAQDFFRMEADGLPGAETEKALIAFQREKGIPVSGRLDLPTVKALGLLGQKETKPANLAPAQKKKSKPPPKSSQTSSARTAPPSPSPQPEPAPKPPGLNFSVPSM